MDLQMDRVLGTTNVVVRLDREEILRHGLDPDRMARELQARVAGIEATLLQRGRPADRHRDSAAAG